MNTSFLSFVTKWLSDVRRNLEQTNKINCADSVWALNIYHLPCLILYYMSKELQYHLCTSKTQRTNLLVRLCP